MKPIPDPWPPTPDPWHLTYAALDARANQLARHLRALGVGPDAPVGLLLERSPELAVALLGVLKAGGALAPLDPAYPAERLAFMLDNSRARVLLTNSIYDLRLTTDDLEEAQTSIVNRKSKIVNLDADWPAIMQAPAVAPDDATLPDHLLYLIYTSGSTGRPKGIGMPHRALLNLLWWQARATAYTGPAVTLQFAPISFDTSMQEVFLTWGTGGTLVLISEAVRREPAAVLRTLAANGVERLFLPFVGLQNLALVAGEQGAATKLREVITAGEQLQITRAISEWFARLAGSVLENQYGPSESHVVTALRLPPDQAAWPPLPPIGRPVANTHIHLLDRFLQPVPLGVPGELYIGGANLARGYLGRPDLTAERFVPNPFARVSGIRSQVSEDSAPNTQHPAPNTRLYRTGDLARYGTDGAIEFLGRVDQQVKVRGYRIEPGEIETLLDQHPAVQANVVAVRDDAAGAKRLVAYVVPVEGSGVRGQGTGVPGSDVLIPDPRSLVPDLRGFLAERLPEYMVPGTFVLLGTLPLTPSGKIDRRALPAPDAERPELGALFVAPRTPTEETIARICAEVLSLARVGVDDNFFDLGGHSLLATQLISRLRDAFQLELPLQRIFETPTVAGLAKHIDTLSWVAQGNAAIAHDADEEYEEGSI